jgi:AbrB family looped-hinge helix DNA binding protein
MKKTIRMDEAGRVVIPRAIRQRFGLAEGSHELEVVESAEGIVLRPRLEEVPAERHASGWIVFRSGDQESTDPTAAIDRERERRHRQITGQP